MKTFETPFEAISDFKSQRFQNDFNLHLEWFECPTEAMRVEIFFALIIDTKYDALVFRTK